MLFETHTLSPPFDQYVESVFHFKDFIPDHSIERVIPTGHIFIIFELDGIKRNTFDNTTLKPNAEFTKVWISGMHRNYISISAHQQSEMFVIQFKAFGAYPFFHFPIEELNEKILPAEAIFDQELLELRQLLLEKESSVEKFECGDRWLKARFNENLAPPVELLNLMGRLQRESTSSYQDIMDTYPHTQKHLIDQCKKYIGLTPKYYQRILRFNEILQQIQKKEKIVWSHVAYQCGYADQSHFIKEFKHFSGFNPQEFIAQEFNQDDPNFFPLDRPG